MALLQEWILHRAARVRLNWPGGVAEAAGVAPAMLDTIADTGTLRHVSRGARGYLARALKVSVRDLESLAAGKIGWIADDRVVDFDRLSPNAVRPMRPECVPLVASASPRLGVPILGRVFETGNVEHFDNWAAEDGPRLPIRYAGLPDAFALKLDVDMYGHRRGEFLVFQTIPPGELRQGELALLTWGEVPAATQIRLVQSKGATALVTLAAVGLEESEEVDLSQILRSARLLGSYSGAGGGE